MFEKKTNIKSLIQALIRCKKGGDSPDKMPISSFGIGKKIAENLKNTDYDNEDDVNKDDDGDDDKDDGKGGVD